MPLGVVLCIFEARPDVVPQLIALAIRSGNGLLLKGSEEVQNSILLLLSILCTALAPYGCSSLVGLIQSREVCFPTSSCILHEQGVYWAGTNLSAVVLECMIGPWTCWCWAAECEGLWCAGRR